MKQSPKCVIFDCDGVLVDSEPLSNRVILEMAHSLGIDIDLNFVEMYFTGSFLHECFRILEDKLGKPLPTDFEKEYRKKTFESFQKELQPVKGVPDLIEQLELPFCVASSGPVNKIRLNLTVSNLLHHFEGNIFSCWDIQKWKPDPAIFLHAAETMGHAPDDCIVVEDSLFGVQAAVAGGFRTYAYAAHARDVAALETAGAIPFYEMEALYPVLNINGDG